MVRVVIAWPFYAIGFAFHFVGGIFTVISAKISPRTLIKVPLDDGPAEVVIARIGKHLHVTAADPYDV
jgi:hypothetical protein